MYSDDLNSYLQTVDDDDEKKRKKKNTRNLPVSPQTQHEVYILA